mmetsp:Transcript_76665/g.194542  ORF Transcript_76665/g.194542 Transcript_76665/m.194542 type:complete len:115 (+) Transcript_76665:1277-1621(+)
MAASTLLQYSVEMVSFGSGVINSPADASVAGPGAGGTAASAAPDGAAAADASGAATAAESKAERFPLAFDDKPIRRVSRKAPWAASTALAHQHANTETKKRTWRPRKGMQPLIP